MKWLVRPILVVICGVISLAALANAASTWIQESSPETALKVNPLNTEARINWVGESFEGLNQLSNDEIDAILIAGMKMAPADARLISLYGIQKDLSGDGAEAQKYYAKALSILPTEIQALIRRFAFKYETNEFAEAVQLAALVMKRWPTYWPVIESYMPELLAAESGFTRARDIFADDPRAKSRIIETLMYNPDDFEIATKLILDWQSSTDEDLWPVANLVTQRLMGEGRWLAAYDFFRQLLSEEQVAGATYLYNGSFSYDLTGSPLDWRIRKQAGVNQSIRTLGSSTPQNEQASANNYLEIQFLDAPLQFNGPSQYLILAPGAYQLDLAYATRDLIAPKPIEIAIKCLIGNRTLVTLPLEATDNTKHEVDATFIIPPDDCEIAQVYFYNQFLAKSWRNRYRGIVNIYEVAIDRLGS